MSTNKHLNVATTVVNRVFLDGYVNIAGNASVVSCSMPNATAARTAVGTYVVTLNQTYVGGSAGTQVTPHFPSTGVMLFPVVAATNVSGAGTGVATVTVVWLNASGAATDPTVSCGFSLHIAAKDSTV
jgi:hypothetical protein